MITQTGIYDLTAEEYHADPCETASLSSSGIRTLLNATPAHFAAQHPRLTGWPEYARKGTKAQDRGTVIHSMLLGKGADWIARDCIEFSNKDGSPSQTWGGAAAKAWKAEMESQGVCVISRDEEADYLQIAEIARQALRQRFPWWDEGQSEQALIWRRETNYGPIWCRAYVDRLAMDCADLLDLKTTAKPIGDEDVARKLALDGADLQAAWYLEGAKAVTSRAPDVERHFHFAHVEIEPPYSVRIDTLHPLWLASASAAIDRACDTFARCLYAGEWPSWPVREEPLLPAIWRLNMLEGRQEQRLIESGPSLRHLIEAGEIPEEEIL